MSTLDELGMRYGTDKATNFHGYTPIYEQYFHQLRDEPIVLVEYGVGGYGDPRAGGQSLRMWAEYFPKATIVGVDNQPKALSLVDRVHIVIGDQTDTGVAEDLAATYGAFDIVIDDASHVSNLTIATFKAAWPHIRGGGFYVCEDTFLSYDESFGGQPDPDAPGDETAMQFFRRMADEVNYEVNYTGPHGSDGHGYPDRYHRGYRLQLAHFWPNLVILRKTP